MGKHGPEDWPQHVPTSSGAATHTGENEEPVITTMKPISQMAKIANDNVGIRATGVALGLKRIPSGFHTVVHHGELRIRLPL